MYVCMYKDFNITEACEQGEVGVSRCYIVEQNLFHRIPVLLFLRAVTSESISLGEWDFHKEILHKEILHVCQ